MIDLILFHGPLCVYIGMIVGPVTFDPVSIVVTKVDMVKLKN